MKIRADRWGLGLGAVALGASLTVWAMHMPNEPVKVVPLAAPHLQSRDSDRAAAAVEDAPEDDAPTAVDTTLLPEQLDRRQLEKGMNDLEPKIDQCRKIDPPYSGVMRVELSITRAGNVQSVSVLPPAAGTPAGACVAKAVKRASFPRYRGTQVPVTELSWPFLFQGPGASATFAPSGGATVTNAAPAR